MDEELRRFVDHARQKGLDLATLRQLLRSAGWKDERIAEAFAARELELPIPVPPGASSARDTFFQVFGFTAFYTWVISLIILVFTYVNLAFPDASMDYSPYREDWAHATIRSAMATLMVAFPIFLVVWRAQLREAARHPDKSGSRVRRALLYVSMFVVAVTLLSDAITLLYYLLEGELTTRFVLKVVALFVIAGGVCLYLVGMLREAGTESP